MALSFKQLAEINLAVYANSLADAGDVTFFPGLDGTGETAGRRCAEGQRRELCLN